MKIEFIVERTGLYGGLKRIYRLAQHFNDSGHYAVVNAADKSKAAWFAHSVPENISIDPDIRIMPEPWQHPHPTATNLLYVQAQFDPPEDSYDGIITTTDHLADLLVKEGFPPIAIIPYGFDSSLFCPDPSIQERGRVAYMPRKNAAEAEIVKMLCPHINFVPIDGVDEASVVREMQKSDVFMLMSRVEGFGMTGFEAALCGCLLVGYHGHGGKKWLTERTCVLSSSPQEIASQVCNGLLGLYEERRINARNMVLAKLAPDKEKERWLTLLNQFQ